MATTFADRRQMQNRLFSELSRMFGREVPLYDRSLAVNEETNKAACALVSLLHRGFHMAPEQLARTSGERHGAIRIGRPDEYRWITRYFACFAMEPHNFYDMTCVGARSQPIIATAFRSALRPEHRVFTSLLRTDWFDPATKERIERVLARREVFSPRAKELIERCEREGGLSEADFEALVAEGTGRIFRWTGRARDLALYRELSEAGFKIAADIACFECHHLNHLTPNTLLMDLYTASMKHCMGELDETAFRSRATVALARLAKCADRDWLRLHFKHLSHAEIDSFQQGEASSADIASLVDALVATFRGERFRLAGLAHSGFKDLTEGPSQDVPVLLRQDAYKALTEPVEFVADDGTVAAATHTARFGEIEERGYACTPAGRELYDESLAKADAIRERDPRLPSRDWTAYEELYSVPFARFPRTLLGLLESGLAFGRYAPTPKGMAAARAGTVGSADIHELVRRGEAQYEGLRYEDFLPVSAAGIFASNLSQYGTKSTAAVRPTYSQKDLEDVMGRPIIDATAVYAGLDAASRLDTFARLGILERVPAAERGRLEQAVAACPAGIMDEARGLVAVAV